MFKGSRLVEKLKERPLVQADERTAYMVNPTEYAKLATALFDFKQKLKSIQVSPKATAAQKNEYQRLKYALDKAVEEADDIIMAMGDTEEVTSESAVSAGQTVKVDWDGPTMVKVLKADANNVTIQRVHKIDPEETALTITRSEFEDMLRESVQEAMTGDSLLSAIDQILSTKTAKEIDGVLVDLQTANVISQVAKALSPENKQKFLGKGISSAATIAWKLVK